MTRKLVPDGVCAACGRVGPVVCTTAVRPLDFGQGLVLEADTTLPDLCDRCNYAQKRWDARQRQIRCPGEGYPYFDGPPKSPPVRREGDVELGPDGWPW